MISEGDLVRAGSKDGIVMCVLRRHSTEPPYWWACVWIDSHTRTPFLSFHTEDFLVPAEDGIKPDALFKGLFH